MNLKKIIDKAKELGASRSFILSADEVPLDPKAYFLCLDCKVHKRYSLRRWSCPPYSLKVEETREIMKLYQKAILVNIESNFWKLTSYNWDTINPIIQLRHKLFHHNMMNKLHTMMIELQSYSINNGFGAYTFGSSPCHACLVCGHSWYLIGEYRGKCKNPEKFRFSPEASGINLYKLAEKFNIPIEIPPTKKVQYMSILLIREKQTYNISFSPKIDFSSCNGCKICQENCPTGAIDIDEKKVYPDRCVGCLNCLFMCPVRVIKR